MNKKVINQFEVVSVVSNENYDLESESVLFRQQLEYEFFENFASPHTKKAYRNDIALFFKFLASNFSGIQIIERLHIVAYRNELTQKNMAPKSINRKLSAISSYMDFLVEKNLLKFNPATSIKRPRQEVVTNTNDLSDDDVMKMFQLLESLPESESKKLHKAVIYLLFSTGIRKSELINLKFKDYRELEGQKIIEIKAKGGKKLIKLIHTSCAEILDDYILELRSKNRPITPESYILRPTKNPLNSSDIDKPLSAFSVDYIVQKYVKLIGVNKKISPHSARATYIGSALENGVDIFKVAQDVGHSSVKTTGEYNKRRLQLKNSPAHELGYLKKLKKTG